VDDTDRLTSYLDGALDPEQEQALEAELAGDAVLRAQLAALRRVDAALALLPAAALPEGARRRLDARLAPAVDEVVTAEVPITAAAPTTAAAVGTDELTRRRRLRRLTVAMGGVAAGLAVLVVGLDGLERFGPTGGDDEVASLALDTDDAADGAEMEEMAPESAADDAETRALLPEVPVVLDDGRRVEASGLDLTLDAAPLQQVAAAALSVDEGQALAATAQRRLLGTMEMPVAEADEEAQEEADEAAGAGTAADSGTGVPALTTPDGRLLEAADATDVRRCVAELLEAGTAAIPVLVELLEVDGIPAVQVGLVTPDAASGAYTRTEVWTLDRASCQPLRFAQS
jgi:hypothetical protein